MSDRRLPVAVIAIVTLTTVFVVIELIAGGAHGGTDHVTNVLGMWPARLPHELWRMVTVVLVNPGYPTRSGHMSVLMHWFLNMLLVVTAGRRVEARVGSGAVIGAYAGGAVASSAFWWATGRRGGMSPAKPNRRCSATGKRDLAPTHTSDLTAIRT